MAELDFGGPFGGLANLIFGSTADKNENFAVFEPKLGLKREMDVFDDVLGSYFGKDELLLPSITSTDDFLDEILHNLDNQSQNETLDFTYFVNNSESKHDFVPVETFTPAADNFTHQIHAYPVTVADNTQQNECFYECFSDLAPENSKHAADLFFDTVPQIVGETVEVELTQQEHSYAAPSLEKIASRPGENANSPFSSSDSHGSRSSFSMSDVNSSFSLFDTLKTTDLHMQSMNIVEEAFHTAQFDDSDNYSTSDFGGANSPPLRNAPYFKSSKKFKSKSKPYSQNDASIDEKYPFLMLSDEEKLLCEKEGVKLPTKFPLTKHEEKELRRIRRKIRNKRSAQESRRKKHEYISSLEHRVRACDKDNDMLRRQVEALSRNNRTLAEQMKKLQAVVGNSNNGTGTNARPAVQAGTCLAVLLLSFCLLVGPNYSLFGKRKLQDEQTGNLPSATNADVAANRVLLPGSTRTLLQTSVDENENDEVRNVSGGSDFYGGEILPLDGTPLTDDGDVGGNFSLMEEKVFWHRRVVKYEKPAPAPFFMGPPTAKKTENDAGRR